MSAEIGNAYDFSDISGGGQVLWTCLSRSLTNNQIMNLAPTVSERPASPAVEVRSDVGRDAWLIPAISVAVHQLDLETRTVASRFKLVPADLDVDSLLTSVDSLDKVVDDLQITAWKISEFFYANPERQVIPDIEDCVVLSADSPSGALTFAWRHDKNRQYVLRFAGNGSDSLQQKYAPDGDLRWPADAPLQVGRTTITFAADGSTVDKLRANDITAIRSALGVRTDAETKESPQLRDSGPPAILDWLLGSWKTASAVGLAAAIILTVVLLPQSQVPTFEVYQVYATTDVRGGARTQPGIILELRAANVAETTNYFADTLRDAGIATTVEQLPGEGMIVIGTGRIDASDLMRDLLNAQGIDAVGREYIEIAIQPAE